MTTDGEIKRRIMAKVGRAVHFKYPGTERPKHGLLLDRVLMRSELTSSGVRGWR